MQQLKSQLQHAFNARKKLLMITNSMRLVNGRGDGLEGLIIDRYHTQAVIYVYHQRWLKQLPVIQQALQEAFDIKGLCLKNRIHRASPQASAIDQQRLLGEKAPIIVQEYGLSFEVNLDEGLNAGLFLDMRRERQAIGKIAAGKRVLNCFAYTCAFGVHAKAHGAKEVLNVDISKHYLEQGRRNYALNQLDIANGFLCFDAGEFLAKAAIKKNIFDIIIIDPPSFARLKHKTFQVKRDLPALLKAAVGALAQGGTLLVSTNNSVLTYRDLDQMLIVALEERRIVKRSVIKQDSDFPGSNTFKESYLIGYRLTLD